jgi:hypothetical protein
MENGKWRWSAKGGGKRWLRGGAIRGTKVVPGWSWCWSEVVALRAKVHEMVMVRMDVW